MQARLGSPPSPLAAWAHLTVLWSFAIAKPLLDILADSPEFFVARENTAGDIVVLALGVTLIPSTLLLLAELVLLRLPLARALVHVCLVAMLMAAVAVQVLEDLLGGGPVLLLALAIGVGASGALAYARFRPVSLTLTVLSPLPLVFCALFLFASPVTDLVFPQSVDHAASGPERGREIPVVMVVFDELSGASLLKPGGRIDGSRYPSFARLAREATWYRNATTVADYTSEAVPAMLSGRWPEKGQLPTRADHPGNLFTLLGSRYRFNVEEPVTQLCPTDLCGSERRPAVGRRLRDLVSDLSIVSLYRLLPEDLEDGLPAVDQTFGDFADGGATTATEPDTAFEQRPRIFKRFTKRVGSASQRPTLDLIHTELPHVPWAYLPTGQTYDAETEGIPGLRNDAWAADEQAVRQGQQRYLLQLGYADRLLGALLRRLRETGLYERAVVVVTADHGVAFQPERHRRAIADTTFVPIAGVPLFIKAPRQRRGRTDDSPARTLDILPTIADRLHIRLPWRSDGRSLSDPKPAWTGPVRVHAKYGSPVELPFAEFVRRREAAVRFEAKFGGAGDGGRGVFAGAGAPRLIGVRVTRLPAASPVAARAQLDDARVYARVDPRAKVLPLMVGGHIDGLPGGRQLVVAVNGRIAATARTYDAGSGIRFTSIVDPRPLRRGANRIALYAVQGSQGLRRLAPLDVAASEYRLVGDDVLVDPRGRRLPVVDGAVSGFVESFEVRRGLLHVAGWSARQGRVAHQVVAFWDGRFLAARKPSVPRFDLARKYGASALYGGFLFSSRVDAPPERDDVRIFGVLDGRASELSRP